MTPPTFFADDLRGSEQGTHVTLSDRETRHVRALRLAPGDAIEVTDGEGRLWRGRLIETRRGATCELEAPSADPRRLPAELAAAVAAKDRTLWLIEKAVELGALAYRPVEFARSRSVADAGRSAAFWRRAGRRAVAALKQCGGSRLPDIGPVQELHDYLDRKRRPAPGGGVARSGPDVVLDPAGETSLAGALEAWNGAPPVRILVGPEGGLEAGELAACREAGFRPVHLGPRTLRFETAAVCALAVAGQRAWSDGRSADGTIDEGVTDG